VTHQYDNQAEILSSIVITDAHRSIENRSRIRKQICSVKKLPLADFDLLITRKIKEQKRI